MKKILFTLLFIYSAQTVLAHQNSYSVTLTFNTKGIQFDKKNAVIKFINSYPGDKNANPENIVILKPVKDISTVTVKLIEPCTGNAFLYVNDSIISMTPIMVLTNAAILVVFKKPVADVYGGENKFLQENLWLYFGLPYSLTAEEGFNIELPKREYELKIPGDVKLENIKLYKKWMEYEQNVIKTFERNKNLYFNLMKLYDIREQISAKTLEYCFHLLPKNLEATTYGKLLTSYIERSKKMFFGAKVPRFEVLDASLHTISSNVFLNTGKYIMLDFWASWCKPCREKIKFLRNIYPSIDTSKIDIISISIDESKSSWMIASKTDDIVWKNYLDSLGMKGNVARAFSINYIPFNVLIDTNGLIVEKNIWGDKLKKYLEEHTIISKR